MERGIPVRSVSRSIAILQAINRHGSLSLIAIARLIGLPYPTANRLVQTLIYEGLIECEPYRKYYRATNLVQSLASSFRDHGTLLSVARPHIISLTKKISWPAGIATHVGKWMMLRDSTNALTSLTFDNFFPGHTFPILECASGHAFMAFATKDEREAILNGIIALDGRSSTTSIFESGTLIARIQKDGFATYERTQQNPSPGKTSSISAPVFEDGKIGAALTITFFSSAMPMAEAVKRFAPEVKRVAAEIAADLQKFTSSGSSVTTLTHDFAQKAKRSKHLTEKATAQGQAKKKVTSKS